MYPKPDIVLHIGLAAGRNFYTLEQGAHGRGYGIIPDVDEGKFLDEDAEKKWPADKFPAKLGTGLDTADVLARWKEEVKSSGRPWTDMNDVEKQDIENANDNGQVKENSLPDVRISPDAGNYMCGFIYYNSLAHYYSLDPSQLPVAFLHVPDLSDSNAKLDTGRGVAVALIRALVESRRVNGVDGQKGERETDGEKSRGAKAETDVNFRV